MTYTSPGGGGETACLHHNPGPGAYKVNAAAAVHITKVVRHGEC